MSRINLTLHADTFSRLQRGAKSRRVQVATYTRKLIEDALARSDRQASLKKLAADYAADRGDVSKLLAKIEAGQLDLLRDE